MNKQTKSLDDFIKNRLDMFGPYEDAMAQEESFLYHSVLSMYLNMGLLQPKQVLDKVLEKKKKKVESIEGFIRQILGWREYIKFIGILCQNIQKQIILMQKINFQNFTGQGIQK